MRKNTKNLAELKDRKYERTIKGGISARRKIKPQWEKQDMRNKDEPKPPPSPYTGNKNKKNGRRKSKVKHSILSFCSEEERCDLLTFENNIC